MRMCPQNVRPLSHSIKGNRRDAYVLQPFTARAPIMIGRTAFVLGWLVAAGAGSVRPPPLPCPSNLASGNARGGAMNCRFANGETPLTAAIASADIRAVRRLVSTKGIDVNLADSDGEKKCQ